MVTRQSAMATKFFRRFDAALASRTPNLDFQSPLFALCLLALFVCLGIVPSSISRSISCVTSIEPRQLGEKHECYLCAVPPPSVLQPIISLRY